MRIGEIEREGVAEPVEFPVAEPVEEPSPMPEPVRQALRNLASVLPPGAQLWILFPTSSSL